MSLTKCACYQHLTPSAYGACSYMIIPQWKPVFNKKTNIAIEHKLLRNLTVGRLISYLISAFAYNLTRLIFLLAYSITCYRCGGTATSCKSAGSATVECDDPSEPNFVYACRVYTVNYTSLNHVLEFKSKKNISSETFSTLKTPPVGL